MTLTCPYCRAAFEDGEDQPVACSACGTLHHAECLAENGGCTVFGCSQAPADEAKVNVSPQEMTRPQLIPSPLSAPAPARVPPPPRVAGAAAPTRLSVSTDDIAVAPSAPIAPGNLPPIASSLSFMGYATALSPPSYSPYTVRKNRVAYVVLAIFFGSFGIHNFYAGYIKKAVIQCCLSVFTFFVGAPFIWVWAVVEACRVSQDSDGVAFT
jgi:TM2 domain-containing membrane protein YozV